MGCKQSSTLSIKHPMSVKVQETFKIHIPVNKRHSNSNSCQSSRFQKSIENSRYNKFFKFLLLGTASSGKSVIFKSFRCSHNGINDYEIVDSIHRIRQNCVYGILILLEKSQELYDKDINRFKDCLLDMNDNITQAITTINSFGNESFTESLVYTEVNTLGEAIAMIWHLPSIHYTYINRGCLYYFPENMDYFFNKVRAIMTETYLSSMQDFMKAEVCTSGMFETQFKANNKIFHIYDPGGRPWVRNKWVYIFDNVTAVLFVAALNHYYSVLFEDQSKNAMHEAIELFTEISNNKWFRKSEMILFLNKEDLFREMIRNEISLSVCFSKQAGFQLLDPQKDEYWFGTDYHPIEIQLIELYIVI